jgi:two-component sensor histidine kinase
LDIHTNIDTAIPIGLIVNELISNSLKHAFPDGRRGEISIAMQRESAILTIVFKDNGIGIPADQDWRNINALGFHLVIALVGQLDGTIELDRTGGTTFTIVVHEMKLADRTR